MSSSPTKLNGAAQAQSGARSTLRLHLGCGGNAPEAWVNVDKSFGPAIERLGIKRALIKLGAMSDIQAAWTWPTNVIRMDLSKDWPWPDGSAEAIYSSHMVEHFPPAEMRRFLDRSFRVLGRGGVLRLAVPDLEASVTEYLASRRAGHEDAADALNNLFYSTPDTDTESWLHRLAVRVLHRPHAWHYDFESMAARMRGAGFVEIERSSFGEGRLPDVEIMDVRPESLFIEGMRP